MSDLKPLIYSYWIHHNRTQGTSQLFDLNSTPDTPVLKQSYKLHSRFGSGGRSYGHVAVDKSGNLFVTDTKGHRIHIFKSTGVYIKSFGSQGDEEGEFFCPAELIFAPDGRLVITDSGAHSPLSLVLWLTMDPRQ